MHIFYFLLKEIKKLLLPGILFLAPSLQAQVTDSAIIQNIYNRGWQYIHTNPDSASLLFETGKKESERRKFYKGLIIYHDYNAILQIGYGKNKNALEEYTKAIAIAGRYNLNSEAGLICINKGVLQEFMGEYAQAAVSYLSATSLLKTNEDRKKVIGLYKNINSTIANLQQQNRSLRNVLPALENDNYEEKDVVSILSQAKANEISLEFPDQTTLREITGGNMYVIFGGAKFLIPDFEALRNYSNYRSIRKIPDGMLSRIPDIPHEGTVLSQYGSEFVWLVKDKMRHHIDNPGVLQFFGGWDALCRVPENTLNQITDAGDTVTMQNVLTTFNFKKEYEVLTDTLKTTLFQNSQLLSEVSKKLKDKNNTLRKRKTLLWTSLVSFIAFLFIGLLLVRNFRQKQKLHRQSLQVLKAEQELQYKKELEAERTRIATDIHDDLGAGLSAIRFLSEKVKRNTFSEVTKNDAGKIVLSSNELVQKMNEIIWAMNEKNDTLEDLLFYTRSYAVAYCEESNLDCAINLPEIIPHLFVSGEIRRNVFLTVKESLHNIVKHANAQKVSIDVKVDKTLLIFISDNGTGLAANREGTGNGLRNMKKRIESVNGMFEITNKIGATVNINIPLQI